MCMVPEAGSEKDQELTEVVKGLREQGKPLPGSEQFGDNAVGDSTSGSGTTTIVVLAAQPTVAGSGRAHSCSGCGRCGGRHEGG